MNPLALFSGPYALLARWVVVGVLAAAIGAYGWLRGDEHGTQKLLDYVAEQAVQTSKLAAARERVVQVVTTRWRTRTETIATQGETIIKEVPIYVSKADDAACAVPAGFVRIYDAAVANHPDPGPAAESDRAASGIPLSVVAETDAYNLRLGHLWRARAEQCVETYNAVRGAGP